MTQGVTGTYAINGTELLLQPTTGRWVARDVADVSGSGHPIYSAPRDFEMQWQLISPSEVNQLQVFFEAVILTGTATVDLPWYNASTYTFRSYTGCVLYEPEISEYFVENVMNVMMIVSNIKT